MTHIITFIFGALAGALGLLYWQRRKPSAPGVKAQGGGGPGEE